MGPFVNQDATQPGPRPIWIDRLAADRPDLAHMAPMFVYLLLLGVQNLLPYDHRWIAALVRGLGGLAVVFLLRRHLPLVGRPHVGLAAACGLVCAAGWFYGQYLCNAIGVPHKLPLLFPGELEIVDPRTALAADGAYWVARLGLTTVFWLDVATRIAVASITVPLVEELFWRAFLLRAFIDWHSFEKIPLGTPSVRAFVLTALLSTLQHPANWLVSIPCWFAFNGLMYWKKSVWFLVWVHGFTNLFLYAWVVHRAVGRGDASAWMFW